ncbi:MAG TPA: LPS-assembly protein LptD [Rhodocyclaceae bacterium]|nr:LPS-assembly protein LptD [Rhodocyclaceae bacterium]
MSGLHRRPLALLVCCVFAGNQAAQAAPESSAFDLPAAEFGDSWLPEAGDSGIAPMVLAADDTSLPLRMERRFDVAKPKPEDKPPTVPGAPAPPGPAKEKEETPIFIVADRIEGRTEEVTEAEGNVEVRKPGNQLFADKVTYHSLDDEVDATGHVRLVQNEDELSGPHLRMKLSEQIGFFEEADYKFKKQVTSHFYRPVTALTTAVGTTANTSSTPLMISVPTGYGLPTTVPPRRPTEGYGHAERVDFEGENQVRLTDATYSTCKPDSMEWYVRAKEMQLDYDREEGTAKDASLVFKDLPIFYSPTGSFSLNHQRKSGFLASSFAASSKNGLDFTVPYYWNLAPNYDVTFFPREMSKRGFQLGGEARYADYNFSGTTRLEYLPKDELKDRSRYAYGISHFHDLGQGLSANINWNGVSDDFYWQDFSSRLLQTSQANLPRQLALNYAPGTWWAANMQLLRYQTLKTDPSITRPYFIEPQINFSGRLPDIYKTDFSVFGQFSQFSHPSMVQGSRAVVYPQFTLPIINPSFTILPKVGLHATQYSLDRQTAGWSSSISRVLPTFTLDSTVFFERDTKWFGTGDYIQTLEPRLFYVYIPFKDQSRIPVFDTAIADFNFAQIFNENRYLGFDRINDANQLTAAVTTRYLDAATGAERFKAMVGQRYYFNGQRVAIPGETTRQESFSNFLAAFNGLVAPKTYVDAAWEYSQEKNQNERYSIGARYQPDLAKVLSASYRFTRDALGQGQVEQVDVAGQWPLTSRWYAVGRYNYSVRDKKLLESIAGLEYNAGCWASRFVVQRLDALSGASNTTFFFQLELSDFTSVGSSPVQLLRRTIPGYGKVNEMPTSGSLLTTQ